jgi:hypothetical protein
MLTKAKTLGIALGALMMLGGASVARARDWDHDCGRQIEHKQRDLDRAIDRHGYYSRQAEHERRELERVRRECRYRDYDRYR